MQVMDPQPYYRPGQLRLVPVHIPLDPINLRLDPRLPLHLTPQERAERLDAMLTAVDTFRAALLSYY